MEPRIQYTKTSDGVNIAYWTMGEGGTPLVMSSPMLFTHATFELRQPVLRAWYERLASRRMIVRFDARGQGLSQRNVGPVRDGQFISDLEDVIGNLGLERVDLAGFYGPGASHVGYATAHPERVRRLVLWSPEESTTFMEGQARAVLSLIESDWELFTETFARTVLGWTGDLAHEWATFMRVAINQEDAVNLFGSIVRGGIQASLPQIQAPTLVLYEAEAGRRLADQAARVAAAIPGARLLPLPHKLIPAFESEAGLRAIEEFLSDGGEISPEPQPPGREASGTAIILFADIADSTALTERLGDAAFRDKARELDEALRAAITSNGGTAIEGKLLGDGVLATFGAAREAISCAMAIHAIAGSRVKGQGSRSDDEPLLLHVGIHAGDVLREEGNVYGGAVNIASRVAGEAAAGETLVSGTVRDLARTSAGVSFENRGERELKGVGEPVRVWAVRPGR